MDHSFQAITALGTPPRSHPSSLHVSRKASRETSIPLPSSQEFQEDVSTSDLSDDVDLDGRSISASSQEGKVWNVLGNIAALGLTFNQEDTPSKDPDISQRFSIDDANLVEAPSQSVELDRPFNKWVKNLQRRNSQRRKTVSCDMDGSALEREFFESPVISKRYHHKKSSSDPSFGFVTAVKSASISLASFCVAPRSKRTGASSRHQRTDRSSRTSHIGRLSEDSSYIARGMVIDQAVTNRLIQRRRVLEEIISTEESYVADIKFLMNVSQLLMLSMNAC